ncbi:hypothetical protein OG413_31515 [Streptomyces sp. NBC_01433]|uniref:hypothetical protein n=1 Tax=Streptomyces sp. NBC_01433 TaxID=2903864 RepID=UPI00225125D0|nr:hypothetical protein [Streptomyces sp. NBC_01433]MCX4679759.1 hypothetical protein [Streptomyces sp. NBC_01433]
MRAIRVAPVALLGATALTLLTPATHAMAGGTNTTFNPTVAPSVIAPGGRVTLGSGGCTGATTVTSGALRTTVIPSGSPSASATVNSAAKRGAVYPVTFACGATGASKSVNLTITSTPATSVPTASSTSIAPPGGVTGGLGGSIGTMDPSELAAGTALVVAAAAGTLYFVRRRAAGRQH